MNACHAGPVSGQPAEVACRGTVVIEVDACKGCDLCVDACPPGVLVMTTDAVNARCYRFPRLLPGCTGCRACSQVCPDFVFQVYKYDTPVMVPLRHAPGAEGAVP